MCSTSVSCFRGGPCTKHCCTLGYIGGLQVCSTGLLLQYEILLSEDVQKGVQENDTVPSEVKPAMMPRCLRYSCEASKDHLNFIMTSDVFDHAQPILSYISVHELL